MALLLTPFINPQSFAQCSFELEMNDTYGDGWNGNTIDVRVGANTTNYTLANGYQQVLSLPTTVGDTIQLTYYASGSYQSEVSFTLRDADGVTIYSSGQAPSAGLNFDTVSYCPPCPMVNVVTLDSITTSSVSFSWASTGAGAYNLEWGPCGFAQGTGTTASTALTNYTITGLTASECVDVYITSNCSSTGSGMSGISGPFSFTSSQPVISSFPFLATFDSNDGAFLASGTNSSWQWGSPTGSVITGASSIPNAWVTNLSGSYNNNELSYLTSPVFDLSAETNDFIFYFDLFYETESCCDETWVEISVDAGITWTKIQGNGTESNWYNDSGNQWWDGTNGGWNQSSINFNNIAGLSGVQFRFVFSSDGSVTRDGIGIDNFGLAALTCGVPTGLTATGLNDSTVVVSWTSSATNFNIEFGPVGFSQGSGTYRYNVTNPDTITGLTAGTSYHVFVQDSCGIANSGIWVGPLTATTLQNTISTFPYTEDFEADQGGWISAGNNNSWQWGAPSGTVISAAGQGTNAWVTNLSGNYNNSELSYIQSPIFDCSSMTNDLEYSFNMIYVTESCCDEGWVEYSFDGTTWMKLVDNGAAIDWYNDLGNQWWDNGSGTTWTSRYNVIPGSGGQSYVQIRHYLSTDGSVVREGFGIDDIVLQELPCAIPVSLGATNLTTSSADIYWSSTGASAIVEWGVTGFNPGTGQGTVVYGVVADTLSLTGLSANTCYDFYVQDSCSAGGTLIGPFNFCTPPTCPAMTNLGNGDITETTAWLNWDGNTTTTSTYLIEYGMSGFQLGSGTMTTSSIDSIQLTGLSSATQYCFYVREICSPGDTSAVAGPFCFFTDCPATLAGDDYTSAIPVSSIPFTYSGNTSVCYTNAISLRGSKEVVFEYTPNPNASSTTFSLCGSGYDTYLFLLDQNFTTLGSNDDFCGLQSEITLTSSSFVGVTSVYVVVEAFSTSGTGAFTLSVDEVTPCPNPFGVTQTDSTCTDVDIVWNDPAMAVNYWVEYGAAGYTLGQGTTVVSADSSETISGLAPGMSYDVYVRGYCGNTDSSSWVGPLTIHTMNGTLADAMGTYVVDTVTLTEATVLFDNSGSVADSVAWDFGDGSTIVYGNNPAHDYATNGTYTAIVTAITDCGVDTAHVVVIVEGISIEESQIHAFDVFPNPTTGVVTVQFDENVGNRGVLELTDLQGRVIERMQLDFASISNSLQMDLSALPKGVYLLRLQGESRTQVERVVLK